MRVLDDPEARAPVGYDVQATLHYGVCALQVPRRLRARARFRILSARGTTPYEIRGLEAEIRVFPGQEVRAYVWRAFPVYIES